MPEVEYDRLMTDELTSTTKGAEAEDDWPKGDQMKKVVATTVRLPVRRPVSFSTRRLEAREFVIVQIRTAGFER
jgi:hypothetical protein